MFGSKKPFDLKKADQALKEVANGSSHVIRSVVSDDLAGALDSLEDLVKIKGALPKWFAKLDKCYSRVDYLSSMDVLRIDALRRDIGVALRP